MASLCLKQSMSLGEILLTVTLALGLVSSAGAEAFPAPSRTVSPVPSVMPQRCCFCVYPSVGETDSFTFKTQCNRCKDELFGSGCDVYRSLPQNEFTDKAIESFNCRSVDLVNYQHGPNSSLAVGQIKVCQSAFPGCPVNLNDISCKTYKDEERAQAAIKEIQAALLGTAQVNICGSASINIYARCDHSRIAKHYVISPSSVTERLGLCPEFGQSCNFDHDGRSHHTQRFACVDTSGRKQFIQCCEGGYWGDVNGCKGPGCDPELCPSIDQCDGEEGYFRQLCIGDASTGFCKRNHVSCPPKKVCKQLEDNVTWCVRPPLPTAQPTLTPRSAQ
jgi:hypothetical protein